MDTHTLVRLAAIELTDAKLLELVDAFLERSGMKPTRFGIEVMREGGLVDSLRKGRSLSIKKANLVLSFIADWRPDNAVVPDPSPTKSAGDIRPAAAGEQPADNRGDFIRQPAEEADSPGPFSEASPSTCSPTGEPSNMPPARPTCSTSARASAA